MGGETVRERGAALSALGFDAMPLASEYLADDDLGDGSRGGIGKADSVGSCVDSCGGQASGGNCWCDDQCAEYGKAGIPTELQPGAIPDTPEPVLASGYRFAPGRFAAGAGGDAAAAEYYEVFDKNPDLAMFLRKLEVLESTLKEKATVVLSADTEPFDLLKSSKAPAPDSKP